MEELECHAVPQATLALPQCLLVSRGTPVTSPALQYSHVPVLLSSPRALLLVVMCPGGSFLPQAMAAPHLWLRGHSLWQPLRRPHWQEALGTVVCSGCGGVLAAGGAVAGRRGLGWVPRPPVAAGLWGWLCAWVPPGREPCSGAGPQAVVASWVGPELGACLERKLPWAGVPSARVSPWGRGGYGGG